MFLFGKGGKQTHLRSKSKSEVLNGYRSNVDYQCFLQQRREYNVFDCENLVYCIVNN
jgi:hypothetical protein